MNRLNDVAESLERAAQWPNATVTAAYAFGALLDACAASSCEDEDVLDHNAPSSARSSA
jgi:hypothetical protein